MKSLGLVFFVICVSLYSYSQQFGHFASATYIQTCYGTKFYNNSVERATPDCINPSCDSVFHLKNFGKHYKNSGDLILKGGELKTFRGDNSNVCNVRMYYVIYPVGNRPAFPSFNVINLPFRSNCTMDNDGNGVPDTFGDSFGPCNGNDEKWNNMDQNIDLTNQNVGTYAIEIYFDIAGQHIGVSNCNDTIKVINSGNNFIATFQILDATITANGSTSFCAGEQVVLSSNMISNTWNTGSTSETITVSNSGTYSVTTPRVNLCNTTDNASINVIVNPLPVLSVNPNPTICKGQSYQLNASGADVITWSNGVNNNESFIPETSLNLTVNGVNSITGCSSSTNVTIELVEAPNANISTNSTNFTPNTPITFFNNSTNANLYVWNFKNGSSNIITNDLTAQESVFEEGNYYVVLTASNNICEDKDSILIVVMPESNIEIPNVFTINDDGVNDFFEIKSANLKEFSISILNRWGSIMFESKDPEFKWDGKSKGKKVTEGVYFYTYIAKANNNEEVKGQGFITIITD